jgi:PhoH-like ATPase
VKGNPNVAVADHQRTFVLDTSVLLADPLALLRFDEHEVVVPVVVITELEGKRAHPELGYFARQALRLLDDLRVENGRLDEPVPVGDVGGTVRVELNHTDPAVLPAGFRPAGRAGDNDTTILAVARNLAEEGARVTLVSKDLPMRVKASAVGLAVEEYRGPGKVDAGFTGMTEVSVTGELVDELYEADRIDLAEARDLPCNTGLVLVSDRGSALGRVTPEKQVRLVRGDRDAFGLHGRSAEQRIALDLLLDPDIGIVSLGGRAGTGKSALALCAGLEAVMERRQHRKVVVFRPLYAVGGQELGYLPGSESEKMNPWGQAVFDTLGALVTGDVVDEIMDRGMLEVLPLTHIRGRSLHDAFVIVDEAQSLERNVLLTVLSRVGQGSRVVLTHDVAQRDNLRVGRYDGVASVIEALKGHPLFAHVTLSRSERSPIAALVTELLEDLPA